MTITTTPHINCNPTIKELIDAGLLTGGVATRSPLADAVDAAISRRHNKWAGDSHTFMIIDDPIKGR